MNLAEPQRSSLYVATQKSPVLMNRRLRAGVSNRSFYADDRWDLTPAILEAHTQTSSVNWSQFPASFRSGCKRYLWFLLNFEPTEVDRAHGRIRVSIATVTQVRRHILLFVQFLEDRQRRAFDEVSDADLEAYADAVRASGRSLSEQRHNLGAIKRLWAFRDWLPAEAQLPAGVPWGGSEPVDLIGVESGTFENRTPRINEVTMASLLTWSLRFIEQLSPEIIYASKERRRQLANGRVIDSRKSGKGQLDVQVSAPAGSKHLQQRVAAEAVIAHYESAGLRLPGRIQKGVLRVSCRQISRAVGWRSPASDYVRRILESSSIEVAEFDELVPLAMVARNGVGDPWLEVPYETAPVYARLLRASCLIVITYLSGMRPSEVLNLRRGCVERSQGLWVVQGQTFKAVKDASGEKLPEGRTRDVPWVVCEPVVKAIEVMEELNDEALLFPADWSEKSEIGERALTGFRGNEDIQLLIGWVNKYCGERGAPDFIPDDDHRVNLSRFRRTLAWHITRRPRGVVAAAIQYGHVLTQVTQGYGGTLASGFPDEYAFERFLARMEELSAAEERLAAGMHVSGPAADSFRRRVDGFAGRFEGIAVRSGKEARAVLSNPDLQIYPGKGLSCVYDPSKALCRLRNDLPDPSSTPDISDCRRGCGNIARTDDDIKEIDERIRELEAIVADEFAPSIRHQREVEELTRLQATKSAHASGEAQNAC